MVKVNNFPKAYAEVAEILKYLPKDEYSKIDSNFIKMLEDKKDKEYIYKLDSTKEIEKQNILKETRTVLAYVFLNYLGTEEENKIIQQKFQQDIINDEKKKQEIYSKDIFKEKEYAYENKNKDLIVYKKENLFERIIKGIIKIFKRKD